MPEELPENRLQRVPPTRFEATDFLPNGKRRMATSFAPLAQPVAAPDDVVEAIVTPEAKERLRLKTDAIAWMLDGPPPSVNLEVLADELERTKLRPHHTDLTIATNGDERIPIQPAKAIPGGRQPVQKPDPGWIPPASAKPVNLYVKPVYNTRWPTAEVVARLIVAACKITGESPFEMYSGKGITTNISRFFVGNVLRDELNMSAAAAGRVLGVIAAASASAMFSPSFAKVGHEKVRAAIVPALAAVIQEFKA